MNMTEPHHFMATQALRGKLLEHEPMNRHVSWRAGGTARRAYVPADTLDLQNFLRTLGTGEPIAFVGLGSNLLVRDGGFEGTVVLMHRSDASIRMDGERVYAEAGAASPKLARFSANHHFEGGEFLAGVPGSVGGALAMNAGCYGAETWDVVDGAHTIDRAGVLRERTVSEFETSYRHVALRTGRLGVNEWFIGAWFRFRAGEMLAARERIKDWLARRVATQPLNLPNAGSVFRNPPGDYAARLIEACGLKGFTIGGARVSEKHANFIVNPGRAASAADIEALIEHVRTTVETRQGVRLVPEVRVIGQAVSE
jgi:UDP-N-acetylmuramate dehydrogenase